LVGDDLPDTGRKARSNAWGSLPGCPPLILGGSVLWNSTKVKKFKDAEKWHSRIALIHARTRLYCPDCRELRSVRDFLSEMCVLECQHRRSVFFPLTAKELTALKNFVNSDDGRRVTRQQVRVVGTEDDTDSQHNWRHATLTVEDVEEAA
jgi:hypothetical protein